MKILVTGGAGFIGSHVVDTIRRRFHYQKSHEPIVFDHRGRGNYQFLGSITDATAVTEAMSHVDGFIHLAGVLGTQETLQNPRPAVETNILGGLNVLEAAAQYKVPGVCIGVGNHFMANTYSITKSTVERLVKMYNAERGTRINVVRAMNAFGPRQIAAAPYGPSKVRKIAPSFICRALKGDPIEVYGGGEQISDMVYVSDLAEALVRSLEAAAKGDVFDRAVEVGPDEHHTVREIAELIKELTGSQSEIVSLPPRPGEQFVPVMADTSTLALVGMKASDLVSVREGMVLTIPYYRNPP